jgi:pyridoxine kinase
LSTDPERSEPDSGAHRRLNLLSIQSEVVFGHVGNAMARFVLQRLGHEAWCVPTVLLSSHAGHQGFTGETLPTALLAKLLAGLDTQGHLSQCDGVLSGYLGAPEQADVVADAVRLTKLANPNARYCLDPAFGDDGKVYARPGVAEAMARTLLPLADIVTPNAFELATLSGAPVRDPAEASVAAALLGRPVVVATSVPCGDRIGTLLVQNGESWLASTPRIANAPRGAGDLFAALFFAQMLAGHTAPEALDLATRATFHVLEQSDGAEEAHLMAEQQALGAPPTPWGFKMEKLESRRRALV